VVVSKAKGVSDQAGFRHNGQVNSALATPIKSHADLESIEQLERQLESVYKSRLVVEPRLTRQLVSFQANKQSAAYRWYKYKEAFSGELVDFLLSEFERPKGPILDPFAGMGTTLFASRAQGLDATGIELLPIGLEIVKARMLAEDLLDDDARARLAEWIGAKPWKKEKKHVPVGELAITRGAYPDETLDGIEKYLAAASKEGNNVERVLRFALLCVLEVVSYTRKDGQYLRWDYRSGRTWGKTKFDKGRIVPFEEAIVAKLTDVLQDLEKREHPSTGLFSHKHESVKGKIGLLSGSCLDLLAQLEPDSFAGIVTSPPYCNRYDYTRTYALELAMLGVGEDGIKDLRQAMLSCTVENRAKDLLAINPNWKRAIKAADNQALLQEILNYLDRLKTEKLLNNTGIARMVRGYFYEMACVIQECSRVMKKGAVMFMVNDNVRYAGASVSVDLILSDMAEQLGLVTERILVLPNGKGNSSQQMGEHGREALRKCVYVWRKK
jgi:DNA modification methylase